MHPRRRHSIKTLSDKVNGLNKFADRLRVLCCNFDAWEARPKLGTNSITEFINESKTKPFKMVSNKENSLSKLVEHFIRQWRFVLNQRGAMTDIKSNQRRVKKVRK